MGMQEWLKSIKHAVYGREMRQALHDAIEENNNIALQANEKADDAIEAAEVDKTLTVDGKPADAKETGARFTSVYSQINGRIPMPTLDPTSPGQVLKVKDIYDVNYYDCEWSDAPGAEGAVLYTAQELTEEQKTKARANIAAADKSSVETLDALIRGGNYIERYEAKINVVTTDGVSGSYFNVDIKTGVYYTVTLTQNNGEIAESYGISLYEVDADGKATNVGILKANENWRISKKAGVDVKQFKTYAGRGIIVKDGVLTLTLEIQRSRDGSILDDIAALKADGGRMLTDNHFMLFTDTVLRGQDGCTTEYANWLCTDYVDLTRRTGDSVTLTATIYSGFGLAFYDKRYVYISGVSGINASDYGLTGDSNPQRVTLALPEGCCYLRATMQMDKYGSGTRFDVSYPTTEVRSYYEIPEYFHADCYFEKKYNRINELMWNSMVKGDAFIFITDEHWANERGYVSNNQGNSIGLLQCLHDYLRIPRLFSGGDTGEYGSGLYSKLLRDNFGGEIHQACGNHDYFNQDNQNASLYMRMDLGHENQIGNHKRHYYYVDNQHQKIRYIVLSAFAWNEGGEGSPATNGYEAEQLEWLQNVALDVSTDWTVLIITHSLNGAVETVDNEWTQVLDAKNTNHNIAAILQGHQHFDWIAHTAGGIPVITTTCDKNLSMEDYRPNGTIKEQAFDVCVLDKEARTLTMVRIGCPVMEGTVEEDWTYSEERVVTY